MAPERGLRGHGGQPGGKRLIEPALERLGGLWAGYWPSSDAAGLVRDVAERFEPAVRAWDLEVLGTFEQAVVGLVCDARRDGQAVVLKVNPRGHEDDVQMAGEARGLEFWRSTGAVVDLLDVRDGGFTLLMERLEPGGTLADGGLSFEERLERLGRIAARLHGAGAPPRSFQHLREFVPRWRDALAGEPAVLAELDALLEPRDDDVLIHLDLHDWNVLASGSGWKAIDPKALRADRHADIWALLDDKLVAALPQDPRAAADRAAAWLDRYSRAAGMDPERARAWTRVRGLAEAAEFRTGRGRTPETDAWASGMERMAAALWAYGR
jgi:streptomycin 6-kinase